MSSTVYYMDRYRFQFQTPLFLNWAVQKGFHIWLKNESYRKHVSILIDDKVWHALCAAQPWRSYATQHIASGRLSRQRGERQTEKPEMKKGERVP